MDRGYDLADLIAKLSRTIRRKTPQTGGLTIRQSALLRRIDETENPTARSLSEMMDIRPASMSQKLSQLEKLGFITRTPDENDSRISRISVTAKGRVNIVAFKAARAAQSTKLASILSDEELKTFCTTLKKLCEYIEQQ